MSSLSAEEATASRARALQDDAPRINAAVKNVFTVLLAQAHAGVHSVRASGGSPTRNAATANAAASASASAAAMTIKATLAGESPATESSGSRADDSNPSDVVSSLQRAAKLLLAAVRDALAELPPPLTWAEQNPQGVSQSAMDRLDEIAKYKVAFLLKTKVEAQPHAKTTSMFGRSLLAWTQCWPRARALIMASNENSDESNDKIPSEVLARFCHVFAASLGYEESVSTAHDPGTAYAELVWAKDTTQFMSKLAEFQNTRKIAAKKRLMVEAKGDDEAEGVSHDSSDAHGGASKSFSTDTPDLPAGPGGSSGDDAAAAAKFLTSTPERGDLNQYWYSPATIAALVSECKDTLRSGGRVAFVSTPSLYFSLPESLRRQGKGCVVLDLDEQWKTDDGFHRYDYNLDPDTQLDAKNLHHEFQLIVIDPPFVTREVWEKYAHTALWLADPVHGKFLCSTIMENAPMMHELLGCVSQTFRPSIPNLVYQYSLYANYVSPALAQLNPEIDPVPWVEHRSATPQHAADAKAVPLHGAQVPESMRGPDGTSVDWRSLPVVSQGDEEQHQHRPEVMLLMSLRAKLGALKMEASKPGKALQKMAMRPMVASAAAKLCGICVTAAGAMDAAVTDVEAWSTANAEALSDAAALAGGVASDVVLESHCTALKGVAAMAREVAEAHEREVGAGGKEAATMADGKGASTRLAKEKYGNFMVVSKRATSAVFRKQGRLLALIKVLKKL